MVLQSLRFGNIDYSDLEVITFPEGILGFGELRKFIIVEDPADEIFCWLQSCEDSKISLPILEPELFNQNHKVNLTKSYRDALKLNEGDSFRTYAIITIPQDPTQMTANIKAPLIFNVATRTARQCVLQDNNLAIRELIFSKLQQRLLQNPQPLRGKVRAEKVKVLLPSLEI